MDTKQNFTLVSSNFSGNINALRVFNVEIGRLAEQHDLQTVKQLIATIARSTGVRVSEEDSIEEISKILEKARGEKNGTLSGFKGDLEDPEVMLLRVMNLLKRQPIQGSLLRQGALVTLISYFETLISDLLQSYYLKYPSALPTDNHKLTLADLRSFVSVEEAEKYVIAKEVESVLRENLDEQLNYFERRFKIDVRPLEISKEELMEVFQRRNLFVHNRGVVDRTYLARVSKKFLEEHKIVEGKQLNIGEKYLVGAIDSVQISGLMLLQQCWRKWYKEESEQADNQLVDYLFSSLVDGRPELTEKLAEFASSIKCSSDQTSRIVIINHAIALKELGKTDKMINCLSQCDWSASSLKFQVALHALRDEEDSLVKTLPKAITIGEIKYIDLMNWPLFRKFRESPKFEEIIQYHFPSPPKEPPLINPENN